MAALAPQPAPWRRADTVTVALLAAAALALFAYGVGVGTLWDQDEVRYVQIAREVHRSGALFDLKLDGAPWFVHPPLFFWLQAATGAALGFGEFAARIWSAVSGALIVVAVFLLGRLWYGTREGGLAGAVAATTLQVLGQARLGVFDPTLVAFMLLALYMYLAGEATGARRTRVLAWGWAGLATATKGPIGLALPAMVVGALWLLRRDWSAWRRIPLPGPLLFAAVGLPWYVTQTVRHGTAFLQTAVGYYMFTRFFGVVENQPGPWWYYGPVLLVGSYPWTAFAAAGLVLLWRRRAEAASQVVLLWCAITVAFYTAAGTKLPNYVLPVYPVLALAVARLWTAAADRAPDATRLMRGATLLLPLPAALLVAAMAWYGTTQYPSEVAGLVPVVAVTAAALAAGPLLAWGLLLVRRPEGAFAALVAAMAAVVPVLVHHTLPAIEGYRPIPRVARLIAAQPGPPARVLAVGLSRSPSLAYYSGRPVTVIEGRDRLADELCAGDRLVVVVPAADDETWARILLPREARRLADDRGLRAYLVEARPPCARAGVPAR
ncbi:MAG: glycosyltransferase family 39 protein [Armatimonadota bacterium]|nr:glycosyltransferase family 39 protein [Armatimonadota bacterium]MDR7454051.1 glycosyltransferase family 39 protein [Armatimonadota bacterium]MDR7512520.1 glycosyltransferase family 39 protein [Armatimonadota bacterium]